jgi:hypothetical protein
MKLREISKNEFESLFDTDLYYFVNGCAFEEDTDNIVAFEWFTGDNNEPLKHYEVLKEA